MKRILIAEDQTDIRDLLSLNLRGAGYDVAEATNGDEALALHGRAPADLLVLDLMMPGTDGLDVCKTLRARGSTTPILMLTAKSTELDRVLGLELGADDYLTKPFSLAELMARVKALLRRADQLRGAQAMSASGAPGAPGTQGAGPAAGLADSRVSNGDIEVDLSRRRVRVAGRDVELTALEFDLLAHFARHPGHVFSRSQLLDAVWGYTHDGYEHTVTTHINRLRAKLEADPMRPLIIQTVRGAGYRMREAA